MKILKINNFVTVIFDNGTTKNVPNCEQSLYEKLLMCNSEEAEELLDNSGSTPNYNKFIQDSKIITQKGASAYIESISQLSVPQDFVTAILKAEKEGDTKTLNAYLNFWTLVSLNPDSRVRNNIFWFIKKWDMKITESGLIVAYRNVDVKTNSTKYPHSLVKFVSLKRASLKYQYHKDPSKYVVFSNINEVYDNDYIVYELTELEYDYWNDENYVGNLEELFQTIISEETKSSDVPVYTDCHTHTFNIRLGHIVSMPREDCDAEQENSCSSGLHIGAKSWLKQNYFGTVGLRCLINPADIVAVPPIDDYGKMRTCAYYPVDIIKYDEDEEIIEEGISTGMEYDFIHKICYSGDVNNHDTDNYTLEIPNISELEQSKIDKNLLAIATNFNRFV